MDELNKEIHEKRVNVEKHEEEEKKLYNRSMKLEAEIITLKADNHSFKQD